MFDELLMKNIRIIRELNNSDSSVQSRPSQGDAYERSEES